MLSGLAKWLSGAGICAITGALAGSFTGTVFGLSLIVAPGYRVSAGQASWVGAALGLIAWIVILWLLLVMGHYLLNSVLVPSLVTCLVVSVVTTWVVNLVHQPGFGPLIGWIVGFLLGRLFCLTCKWNVAGVNR